jgi:hypothetical protein
MASDGSGKTSLSGSMGSRMSDIRYGETYWTVEVTFCTATEAKTPEGQARYRILVAPVETDGEPFEILNDVNVNPLWGATFRPGDTPRVTYVAVVWGSNGPTAGLYQIEFDETTGAVAEGSPVKLMDCGTFDDWSGENDSGTVPQMSHHDWLDADTVVYGDGAYIGWASVPGRSLWAQLYVGHFDSNDVTVKDDHTALIAEGEAYMGFGVAFNPSGTKVIYTNIYGIYEVSTTGDSVPTEWVPDKGSGSGGRASYLDDDTIIYTWVVNGTRKTTCDVYKMKRGSAGSNLTSDTSAWCDSIDVR